MNAALEAAQTLVGTLEEENARLHRIATSERENYETALMGIGRLEEALRAILTASPQSYDWYQNTARAALAGEDK